MQTIKQINHYFKKSPTPNYTTQSTSKNIKKLQKQIQNYSAK